jgi:hypothetical protein
MRKFINKIFNQFVVKVGIDKLLHFSLAGFITALCGLVNESIFAIGVLVVAAAAVIKEYIDDKFDTADLFWTGGGIFVSVLVYLLTQV